jgi:hypothetical protein
MVSPQEDQVSRSEKGTCATLWNQLVKKCAVKSAGLQRVKLPPGNWFAPLDQLATRERQAGPYGVAERLVRPMKPGNAGGGKGPQLKTNATSDKSLIDVETHGEVSMRSFCVVWRRLRA